MTLQSSSDRRKFKNTFAPHVKNKELSIYDIIMGLKTTVIHSEDLPLEIKDAVEAELKKEKT